MHQRWSSVDLATQGRELQNYLGTKQLTLLHAEGNIIWSDHSTVYRLSPHRDQRRCLAHLDAVRTLLREDPTFPTAHPTSSPARAVTLPTTGPWMLTTWQHVHLTPVDHTLADNYYQLGQLLRRLHHTRIPGLTQHDPLQWANGQIETLAERQDVTPLRARLKELSAQHTKAFAKAESVTVHGDVHWHQVATDPGGQILLLDFESIAIGHPTDDLEPSAGWIRRTGRPTGAQRAALRAGYGDPCPEQTPEQAAVSKAIAEFELHTWHQARSNYLH